MTSRYDDLRKMREAKAAKMAKPPVTVSLTKLMFTPGATVECSTPPELFAKLNRVFDFSLDPCATAANAKCPLFFTKEQDGLIQDWKKHSVFVNPPYGRALPAWVRKCYMASQQGALVVALLPARIETRWYHDWVERKAAVRFLRGRLKFGDRYKISAPFPFMLAIYGDSEPLFECDRCGNFFRAKRSDARACSNACRQALHRNGYRAKRNAAQRRYRARKAK